MKKIDKVVKIFSAIFEICHWVAAVLMTAATICAAFMPKWIGYFVSFDIKECCGTELAVYGFEVQTDIVNGNVDKTTFILFGIGSVIILVLMALIFRNLYNIFKKSENATPFIRENVSCLKKIGIFAIAVPLVGLLMSIIIRLIIGVDAAEISVDQSGIFMGIVVLCLTQYFAYGVELEKDVDGLV